MGGGGKLLCMIPMISAGRIEYQSEGVGMSRINKGVGLKQGALKDGSKREQKRKNE